MKIRYVNTRSVAGAALMVVMAFSLSAGQSVVAADARQEFFENKVRPLLVKHCYECHAEDEAEAGLQLDSKAAWEKGGDSGAAIIPGDPDGSLVIEAVRYSEEVIPGMPPDSRMSDEEIGILTRWVADGAFDPRAESVPNAVKAEAFSVSTRRAEHWSWQPISNPELPKVEREEWSTDPFDRFILARLEDARLVPAEDADALVWLRRVSFDLTGLPPTQRHIERLVSAAENEPSLRRVRESIVDELLESTAFGEKWARHWMDLVRYAESFGHEFDYTIPHAFEYRDYLIRAFNLDLPYDQLIREHVAGDLLPSPRLHPEQKFNESVIGTGFWHLHEATHAPTDILQNEADIAANQIDVFGKAFLGLTVACARCHDHKFDAISTADYYGMFSYLQSSRRVERPLDVDGNAKRIAAEANRIRAAFATDFEASTIQESKLVAWESSDATCFEDFSGADLPDWVNVGNAFSLVPHGPESFLTAGKHRHLPGTIDSAWNGEKAAGSLQSHTFTVPDGQIHLRVRSDANQMIRIVIDNYQLAPANALLFRGTLLNGKGTQTEGEWKWLTIGGELRKYVGQRAFLEFIDFGPGSIAVDEIWFSKSGPPKRIESSVTTEPSIDSDQREPAERKLKELVESWPNARFVLAMAEGSTIDVPVYIRGSHTNQGQSVPGRILEALGGHAGTRLELADQIASGSNPLTARVYVNRLWHQLFGRGIVESVDDFGPQGNAPSHPMLLDYLASEFIASGWSTKSLLRRFVLSRTYRQSSVANAAIDDERVASVDPSNRLLHKMNVRRLPAESIRDAVLASAGTLSSVSFGRSVPTHRTPFMTGRGARKSGPLDGNGRRSVYLAVYRNFLNPFLTTFDRPNPFGPKGRRSRSNVPAQSLALMNDPFMIDQAKRLGEKIDGEKGSIAERVESLVYRIHSVRPETHQVEVLEGFLQQQIEHHQGSTAQAWADLVHALWNMKAFIFLR